MARTAGLVQRLDESPRIVQVGQRRGFGQLDEQPPRRHAAALQFAGNIFGQRRPAKERPEMLIASDGTSASAFPLEKALRGCAGYRRLMSTCERR